MDNNNNIITSIKYLLTYIKDWHFRFRFLPVFALYCSTILAISGLVQWLIKLDIQANESGKAGKIDAIISSANPGIVELLIILIITIAFLAILFYHDREQYRQYKIQKQNSCGFKEIYVPFFEHVFSKLDLENYYDWSYNLAVSGETTISRDRYYQLRDLAEYCKKSQCIQGYELFHDLSENLSTLITDLLNVFDLHSRPFGEERYHFAHYFHDYPGDNTKLNEFYQEVWLISDLTLEMTRLLNYLLTKIRDTVPDYLAQQGVLTIRECPIERYQYSESEKTSRPYPGLEAFVTERKNRSYYYSDDSTIIDTLKKELLSYS